MKQALRKVGAQGSETELRKDMPFSVSNPVRRVYLGNFDEPEKGSQEWARTIEGHVSPRHPKKAVARKLQAEVQGAIVDGSTGIAYPKTEKVMKYAHLATLLLKTGACTQNQMQIVGGGFVYIAMFRRPLLGALNHIWEFIVSCENRDKNSQFPREVKQEIARFLGLLPLAYMDFRCQISSMVTASDASQSGGGVTASQGLTALERLPAPARLGGPD